MSVHSSQQAGRAAKGGLVAGLWAGLLLSIILALMTLFRGHDVWQGLKFAGSPFLGERALASGFDAVAVGVGMLSHFAVSAAWGVAFGLLFYGLGRGATIFAGVVWGIAVWIGMLYVVMPMLGFPAGGTMPLALSGVTHVLFGVTLAAAFLPYQRELPPAHSHTTAS